MIHPSIYSPPAARVCRCARALYPTGGWQSCACKPCEGQGFVLDQIALSDCLMCVKRLFEGISYPTGGYGAFGRGAISAPLPHNCRHALRTWVNLPVLFPNSVDFGAQRGIALLTGSALAAGEERFGELPLSRAIIASRVIGFWQSRGVVGRQKLLCFRMMRSHRTIPLLTVLSKQDSTKRLDVYDPADGIGRTDASRLLL
jgi:hypothetical protein